MLREDIVDGNVARRELRKIQSGVLFVRSNTNNT
jgi:hypothetical protein